ncbi:MAG: transposase [Promethearchaeati archaeon SRVP18_Atabeyarchaeia-1]
MQVTKTVRIPVHYSITRHKLGIIDKLTARLTCGVDLWSRLIEEYGIKERGKLRSRAFEAQVKERTGLGAGLVQCCGDTALWMWRSYRELHRAWAEAVEMAGRRKEWEWHGKLLRREPRKPLTSGLSHKVPIWFDYRVGKLEHAKSIRIASHVIRVATLRKGEWVTIPLNAAPYHAKLLELGTAKSFQIVKKDSKYYVHVKIDYDVPDRPVAGVLGVDLGVKRQAATVLLIGEKPRITPRSFTTIRDGEKRHRLDRLNRLVSDLQQAGKYDALRRLRHKRKRVAEHFDRVSAVTLADMSEGCLLVVGYPKGIKYRSYRGNGKRKLRKALTRWSYGRIMRFTVEERAERGLPTLVVDERWTSRTCWKCGSRQTLRLNQSTLFCRCCGMTFNADYNGALNIGLPYLANAAGRGAADEPAQETGDEQAREIVACKPGSQHPSRGW